MEFKISREQLVPPLTQVCGIIERRQIMPILSNVLLDISNETLTITASNMDTEMVSQLKTVETFSNGSITVPAKKMVDICKTLPEGAIIWFKIEGPYAILKSGRSRFKLSTLPAQHYPNVKAENVSVMLNCKRSDLKDAIETVSYAMASNDVRHMLNGLLIEQMTNAIRFVATDGHRLALCSLNTYTTSNEVIQKILPRKAVADISRLLNTKEETVQLSFSTGHAHLKTKDFFFTSKLIEGKYPDYHRIIPPIESVNLAKLDKAELLGCVTRASIMMNDDKINAVRLIITNRELKVTSHSNQGDTAEDHISVEYTGAPIEIGFKSDYLKDLLKTFESDEISIGFRDSNSSVLVEESFENRHCTHIVMPMKL